MLRFAPTIELELPNAMHQISCGNCEFSRRLVFDPDSRPFGFTSAGGPKNISVLQEAARAIFGPQTELVLRLAGMPTSGSVAPEAGTNGAAPPAPSGGRPATIADALRVFGAEEQET